MDKPEEYLAIDETPGVFSSDERTLLETLGKTGGNAAAVNFELRSWKPQEPARSPYYLFQQRQKQNPAFGEHVVKIRYGAALERLQDRPTYDPSGLSGEDQKTIEKLKTAYLKAYQTENCIQSHALKAINLSFGDLRDLQTADPEFEASIAKLKYERDSLLLGNNAAVSSTMDTEQWRERTAQTHRNIAQRRR